MIEPRVVMACGHVSSATWTDRDGAKYPVCPSCLHSNPKAAREVVSLSGRVARCRSCRTPSASSTALFDFQYNRKGEVDSYYDGCDGW